VSLPLSAPGRRDAGKKAHLENNLMLFGNPILTTHLGR
jgi:hypothetical protein